MRQILIHTRCRTATPALKIRADSIYDWTDYFGIWDLLGISHESCHEPRDGDRKSAQAANSSSIAHLLLRRAKRSVIMAFIAKPVKPGTHADKSKRKRVHESADGAKVLHKKAKIDTSTSASKLAAKCA